MWGDRYCLLRDNCYQSSIHRHSALSPFLTNMQVERKGDERPSTKCVCVEKVRERKRARAVREGGQEMTEPESEIIKET